MGPVQFKAMRRNIWNKPFNKILHYLRDVRDGLRETPNPKIGPPGPILELINLRLGCIQLVLKGLDIGSILIGVRYRYVKLTLYSLHSSAQISKISFHIP